MNQLKIGAIGCGYWGPNLIRNFIEIPEADLVAVVDLDQSRLDHMQTRYPQIEVFTNNYRDLFALGLDAVLIATPPQTHLAIAKDCLQHGLHILVEKPLTLNSQDAQELVDIATQQERILMVGHTFEYNPAVRYLRELINSGELGEIRYIDAVRASLGLFQTYANVLWDLAPHDISILRYILDADPINIRAHGASWVRKDIESVAYAIAMFPNNILAHIRNSWLDPSKTRRITVVGSKKMVIYDDVEPLEKIKIYDKGVRAIRHTDTFGEFNFAYHYGDVTIPYLRLEEPLRVQCLHFLECIRENKSPLTDGYNGLKVVEIIEAAHKSLKNGGHLVTINGNQVNGKHAKTSSDTLSEVVSV